MIPFLVRRVSYKENGEMKFKLDKVVMVTVAEIAQICRDFQADCRDGFVSNDEAYITEKLKHME